jgi:hypothetical protein
MSLLRVARGINPGPRRAEPSGPERAAADDSM